ncbi:MAG: hypothetical protein WBM04_05935 [Candidatus Korobacteraceae bacterium]
MSPGPDPILELRRREKVWNQAIDELNASGKLAQESQISGARDMLGYFEKLAFFDGSAAALVITFIGSAKRTLAPAWGIKAGLVLLLLGVVGAMLRNWCYFRYAAVVHQAEYLRAQAKEQVARADLYEIAPRPTSLQTGKALNRAEFKSQVADSNKGIDLKLNRLKKMERNNWGMNVWSGNLAQIFTAGALALLGYVALTSL